MAKKKAVPVPESAPVERFSLNAQTKAIKGERKATKRRKVK